MYTSSTTNSLNGGEKQITLIKKGNMMKNNLNNRPECLNNILRFDIDEVEAVLNEDVSPFSSNNSIKLLDEVRNKVINPEKKEVVAGGILKENQLVITSKGTPALTKQEEYELNMLLKSRMTLDTLPKLQPPVKSIKSSSSAKKRKTDSSSRKLTPSSPSKEITSNTVSKALNTVVNESNLQINAEQLGKYFGNAAKKAFFNHYHEMNRQKLTFSGSEKYLLEDKMSDQSMSSETQGSSSLYKSFSLHSIDSRTIKVRELFIPSKKKRNLKNVKLNDDLSSHNSPSDNVSKFSFVVEDPDSDIRITDVSALANNIPKQADLLSSIDDSLLNKYSSNYYSTERELSCYSLLDRDRGKNDNILNNSTIVTGFEDSEVEDLGDSFAYTAQSWSYVDDDDIADIHTSHANSRKKNKTLVTEKDQSNNLNSFEDISGVLNRSLVNISKETKQFSTMSNISYTSRYNFDLNGKSIDTKILPPAPTSPRTTFIGGCIREGINPLSRIIIRKKLSSVLNLERFNLGDITGKILAECIHQLPFVDSVNLADNNLTDFSLKHLLNSMMKIETLTNLNLSRNKIDGYSSTALAKWCSSPACTIRILTLQHADVDDGECNDFVSGLYTNSRIRELDLSHNFIGQKEGMKGVITGGTALAKYLESNKCGLTTLKVSWNSIRLDSACELSRALAINNTLTFLDLSYNGMGSAAGEALGDSIAYNKSLKTLIISNNNLNGCACFTICVGVQENFAMKYLCMDENPIGELGAKAMLQIPVMCGSRVSISAASCNTGLRGDPRANSFDYSFPCREYELKMDVEFDRAVAMSILQIVASHSSYIFQSVYYELPGQASKRLKLVQAISKEKEKYFDENQKAVVFGLKKMLEASSSVEAGTKLFLEADADGSGELDREELEAVLGNLGFPNDSEKLDDIFTVFDVDGAGLIGLDEFLAFLQSQSLIAASRIHEMCEVPVMSLEDTNNKKYVPPKKGVLKMKVVDGYAKKARSHTISSLDNDNAMSMAKRLGDITLMSTALPHNKLRFEEGLKLFNQMKEQSGNQMECLQNILPQLLPYDARKLISHVTNDDRGQIDRLKKTVGPYIRTILGGMNGFYSLNLGKAIDRTCLSKLFEQSMAFTSRRQYQSAFMAGHGVVGDPSQTGNWSCFRNGIYKGEPVIVTPSSKDFNPMPKTGILEFDFSGASRPEGGELVLSDERMVNILINNLCLLERSDEKEVLKKLKEVKEESAPGLLKVGYSMFECPLPRAIEIGAHVDYFYENLEDRRDEYAEAMHREEILINFMEDAPEELDIFAQAKVIDVGGSLGGDCDDDNKSIASIDDKPIAGKESSLGSLEGSVSDNTVQIESLETKEAPNTRNMLIMELRRRIKALMRHPDITVEAKAFRMTEVIEEFFSKMWLRARHVALIIECFPYKGVDKTENFGTYVVDMVCSLFGKIVDLHNFELVLRVLTAKEAACIQCRLGMLNIWNPYKCEGAIQLNLSRREERITAKALLYLTVAEPGPNLSFKSFQWKREEETLPGWEITVPWVTEAGFPQHGIITMLYYSGENQEKEGCKPSAISRKALTHLCLIKENEVIPEESGFLLDPECHKSAERHLANAEARRYWAEYLCPTREWEKF